MKLVYLNWTQLLAVAVAIAVAAAETGAKTKAGKEIDSLLLETAVLAVARTIHLC